jgi:hypothetical protein
MESLKGWKHVLPPESEASWKLIQAGKESDWEVKTVCRLENRIFIVGKPKGNDEFDIYVYDVDEKVWEALEVEDVLFGPKRSQFYASVAIPTREWVLVFWENILPQDSELWFNEQCIIWCGIWYNLLKHHMLLIV